MKCEKCGAEIETLGIDILNYNGACSRLQHNIKQYSHSDISVDVSLPWAGETLDDYGASQTIHCPRCGEFPFRNREVRAYEFVRIICFKMEEAEDG